MKQIYNWASKQVHTKYATPIFALLSFIEGFFFVPLTALFVLYGIEKPKHSFFFATLAIIITVIGGIIGYLIGHCTWHYCGHWINLFISSEKLDNFIVTYKANQNWTIFLFTLFPFPFKAITIACGFFRLPLLKLLVVSLIGRSIRFYSLAIATFYFGQTFSRIINEYFYMILSAGIAAFGIFFWVIS
ncbi:hypothetical protein M1446_02390 [Candidatus Dependentiae bacterium]|nr:hypothetical protein [Candidatus Dependentiae bacterium]